jgi:hypothetical protein
MTGGGAEATQIPAQRSSLGSRRGNPVHGLARRPAERRRAATPTMSRLGGPLRVPATTGGRPGLRAGVRRGLLTERRAAFREALPRTSTGQFDRAGLAQEQHKLEPAGDGRRNKR